MLGEVLLLEETSSVWSKQGSGEQAPGTFSLQCLNKHVHYNENQVVSELQCTLKMFNTAIT